MKMNRGRQTERHTGRVQNNRSRWARVIERAKEKEKKTRRINRERVEQRE